MTITSSIGSAGRTYSTIQAWEDSIPASPADHYVGECYNDSEFSAGGPIITFSGSATSASATVTLKCAAGQSFYDNANKTTNALRYNQANGVALKSTAGGSSPFVSIGEDYVTIDGLQVSAGGFNGIEQTTTGTNVVIKNVIVESSQSASGGGCLKTLGATVINSLAINTGGGTGVISNGSNSKFHNVTSVQLGAATNFGFRGNYDSPLYLNCAAFGFATCFRSGNDAASNYNASGDTTAPGANSIKSKTFANQFVDITNTASRDLRVKAGADLINAGTRDATYTADLDIIKQARSTTTPTIGASEYVASGGGTDTPVNPGVGTVALTGYAPTVAQSANQSVAPGAGSLTVTGYAPTIAQPLAVNPGAGTLTVTGYAPTVTQSVNTAVNPDVGALAISGYAPTVAQTANQSATPGVGSLIITGYAPSVTQASLSPDLQPGVGSITITGYAPTVTQGNGSMAGSSMAGISPQKLREFLKSLEPKEPKQPKKRKREQVVKSEAPTFEPEQLPGVETGIPASSPLDQLVRAPAPQQATAAARVPGGPKPISGKVYRAYLVDELMQMAAIEQQQAIEAENEEAAIMLLLM